MPKDDSVLLVIARIKGEVWGALPGRIVVGAGGVGYQVLVPVSTYDRLNPLEGEAIDLKTYQHVRENSLTLYGFANDEERDVFLLLIDRVSGIGPAIAMAVLSGLEVKMFKQAVVNGDAAGLSAVKGIGKKTAERKFAVEMASPPLRGRVARGCRRAAPQAALQCSTQ